MTLAIDRQTIINGVFLGLGKVAYGPFRPGEWYCQELPKNLRFDYDLGEAREKLKKEGWELNEQGFAGK